MKIAFYMEDGLEQIVLTPDSDTEKAMLGKLHDETRVLELKRGSFYECRGGYERYRLHYTENYGYGERDINDESTILVLRPAPKPSPELPQPGEPA